MKGATIAHKLGIWESEASCQTSTWFKSKHPGFVRTWHSFEPGTPYSA